MFKKLTKKIINLSKRRKESDEDVKVVEFKDKELSEETNPNIKSIFRDPKKLLKISAISLISGLTLGLVIDITTDREAEEAKINNLQEEIINIEVKIDNIKADLEKYEEYQNILESIDISKDEIEKAKGDK